MTIKKEQNGTAVTLFVEGRLDTVTSPDLEKEIHSLEGAEKLTLNFEKLEYISSSGLRILLSAHKEFSKKSGLSLTNVKDAVLDVFDVTGFKDILNLE
ncbi:MAG: STAS domain-containing protein [Treponema sp.]|nr:STAS domain-containing protein [Treponema sp.]